MLSAIDETKEEPNEDVPDSPAKKLAFCPPQQRLLAEHIGGHGPWQFRQWLVYFSASACSCMHLFSTFPLAAPVDCRCRNASVLNTSSCHDDSCSYESPPSEIPQCFNPYNTFSTLNQAVVQCSHTDLLIYAKCIYLVGIVLSALIILPLTKKFSFRVVALVSGFVLLACSLATCWAETVDKYLILRLLASFGMTNIYFVTVLSLLECLGEEYRLLYALIGHLGWGMAHFLVPLILWLCKNWMQYNLVLSSFTVPLFLLSCFIPESIDGCVEKGLRARAQKLIRIAAWKNGITTVDVEQYTQIQAQAEQNDLKLGGRMKTFHRMFELFLLFLVGFTSSFAFFLSVNLTDWNRWDRGAYLALVGTTEVAAAVVLLLALGACAPKRLWAASTALAGVFFLVMYSRAKKDVVKLPTGPFLLSMFFASTSWTIALVQSLFRPMTSSETRCRGMTSVVAMCLGAAVASLADLQKYSDWNPKFFVVYGIPILTVGTSVAFIPDRYLSL